MRPVGDIYLELEKLYDELVDDHGMQMGDMLYWLYGHLKIHRPDSIEEYTDDSSNPEFKYSPKTNKQKVKRQIVNYLRKWEGCRLNMKDAENLLRISDGKEAIDE
jgi:hypothetical protein